VTAPTAPAVSPAREYLDAVGRELADLPVEERADLLEDLAMHLSALDEEDDPRPHAVRLGPPAAYAAELRQAAGLPPRGAGADPRVSPVRRVKELARRAAATRAGSQVVEFVPQLRPAWWVARGYLVVFLPAVTIGDARGDIPVPSPAGSPVLGLALVALAVVASVRLGQARMPAVLRAAVVALNVGLAVWALATVSDLSSRAGQVVYLSSPGVLYDGPLQSYAGPVTDIYPYAADGTPLEGVLLYDQDGRPLRPVEQEWFADRCRRVLAQPRAADGVPVPHSFPQQYVLDPRGETLDGTPAAPGQCVPERPRPTVPLPVFSAPQPAGAVEPAASTGEAPGAEAERGAALDPAPTG